MGLTLKQILREEIHIQKQLSDNKKNVLINKLQNELSNSNIISQINSDWLFRGNEFCMNSVGREEDIPYVELVKEAMLQYITNIYNNHELYSDNRPLTLIIDELYDNAIFFLKKNKDYPAHNIKYMNTLIKKLNNFSEDKRINSPTKTNNKAGMVQAKYGEDGRLIPGVMQPDAILIQKVIKSLGIPFNKEKLYKSLENYYLPETTENNIAINQLINHNEHGEYVRKIKTVDKINNNPSEFNRFTHYLSQINKY